MRRRLHNLATWLALVACLLTGIAPAQAVVVCLEPDGTIRLEAAAAGCGPCDEPGDASTEAPQLDGVSCPCIDIELPARGDEPQVRARLLSAGELAAAIAAPTSMLVFVEAAAASPASSVSAAQRTASVLTLIGTVVLRV